MRLAEHEKLRERHGTGSLVFQSASCTELEFALVTAIVMGEQTPVTSTLLEVDKGRTESSILGVTSNFSTLG